MSISSAKKTFRWSEKSMGYVNAMPDKWEDIEAKSFQSVIDHFIEDSRVYDCDGGGDETYIIGISDGNKTKYFKIDHEFHATRDEEWNFSVDNYFKTKEVTKEEADMPGDRDWLDIRQRSYPEIKKWPPRND